MDGKTLMETDMLAQDTFAHLDVNRTGFNGGWCPSDGLGYGESQQRQHGVF